MAVRNNNPNKWRLLWCLRSTLWKNIRYTNDDDRMPQSEPAEQCCLQQKTKRRYGTLSHMDSWSGTVLTWDFSLHLSQPHHCMFFYDIRWRARMTESAQRLEHCADKSDTVCSQSPFSYLHICILDFAQLHHVYGNAVHFASPGVT